MDYLRIDGKRGHVRCGNRLAIEREESFQNFASFEEELMLCLGLLGSYSISHGLISGKMTPARLNGNIFLKSTRDASYILAKGVGWPGYEWALATFR